MKNKFHFVFSICLFLFFRSNFSFSQNAYNDSLKKVIATSPVDSEKVKAYNELAWQLKSKGQFEEALKDANSALELSEKINYKRGEGFSYNMLGSIAYNRSEFATAINYFHRSYNIRDSLGDKKGTASVLNNLGNVYLEKGDYENALNEYMSSLKIREAIGNKYDLAISYGNLANIYEDRGDSGKALTLYKRTMSIGRELHDSDLICSMLMNIGNLYLDFSANDSVLHYYTPAISYFNRTGNKERLSSIYLNMGNVYHFKGDNDFAMNYYMKSNAIDESDGDKQGMALSSENIGVVLLDMKRYAEAKEELLEALQIARSIDAWTNLKRTYSLLARCDTATGNFKEAFYYQKLSNDYSDSITNDANNEHIAKMNAEYAGAQKDQEILLLNKDKEKQAALNEEDAQRKNIVLSFVVGGLILVLAFAIYIFKSYRQKQKINSQLEEKNSLIENQKKIVEERNKEITDSILYAKKIQGALLASDKLLEKNLPSHFVFYRPKDIVSGDFYWANSVNEKFLLATCDCTGHGVPGAFMSLLNISFLNEAAAEKKIFSTGLILDHVRTQIISALNQETESVENKDGMDCALCCFDFTSNTLEFSCANNGLWIVRNHELLEFKPDKMPVGIFSGVKNNFSVQTFSLRKGDIVYTFTDGYADQFGGEKGKKFKYSRLKELILSIHHLPMNEQQKILSEKFVAWKGNLEQVDDVLLIGVKIK